MSEQLLAWLLTYGLLALAPVLTGAALGLPLPASLILLAAGAFAGQGEFALPPLLIIGVVAAVVLPRRLASRSQLALKRYPRAR